MPNRPRDAERDARDLKIAALLAEGHSAQCVGDRFGLTLSGVHHAMRRHRAHVAAPRAETERSGPKRVRRPPNVPPKQYLNHPATSDAGYNDEETEFLKACENYRTGRGKPFLLACDYLRVLLALGYRKMG